MIVQKMMYGILIGVTILCGYLRLLQHVRENAMEKQKINSMAVILAVFYVLLLVPFFVFLHRIMEVKMISITVVWSAFAVGIFIWGWTLNKYKEQTNARVLIVFLIYILAVGYITIFSRDTSFRTGVVFDMNSVSKAIEERSVIELSGMILNIVLFMPLGFLLPCVNKRFGSIVYSLIIGMMVSAFIETTQMAFEIGLCDFEDLCANTAGALAGWVTLRIWRQERKKWKLDIE